MWWSARFAGYARIILTANMGPRAALASRGTGVLRAVPFPDAAVKLAFYIG